MLEIVIAETITIDPSTVAVGGGSSVVLGLVLWVLKKLSALDQIPVLAVKVDTVIGEVDGLRDWRHDMANRDQIMLAQIAEHDVELAKYDGELGKVKAAIGRLQDDTDRILVGCDTRTKS